jgi:CMP-N-acetylneuraminic acid synthetase
VVTPPALAIVLARGGSKGLPRKNALPIAGRPCIEWTLDHAAGSASIGPIVLSTDDAELMAIGRAWARSGNAERLHIIERESALASDNATIDAAARSALIACEAATAARLPDDAAIVILYGNVPVRPADLSDRAVAVLRATTADSVQSYAPVGKFHPWWMTRIDAESGEVRPWEGDVLNHGVFRRQDLPAAFVPDGGVIAVRRSALMLEIPGLRPGPHAFFGREDRRRGVINREGEVVDIDTQIDRVVAEAILSSRPETATRSQHRGIPA